MRQILTILFLAIVFSSSAQNWQMFPLDSLRCYINPSQDSVYLQGVDYRHYEKFGDTTVIDLGWFARPDTLRIFEEFGRMNFDAVQIKSHNSNFGRKAIITDDETKLVFVQSLMGNIRPDTLTFLNYPTINSTWNVLENEELSIGARLLSRTKNFEDSIQNIELNVAMKLEGNSVKYLMKVSKKFGLLLSPVFYEILDTTNHDRGANNVAFEAYKELSPERFLTPLVGTESIYKMLEYPNQLHVKSRILSTENRKFEWHEESIKEKYGSSTYSEKKVLRDYNHFAMRYYLLNGLSDSIYNPIPGRYNGFEHSMQFPFQKADITKICDKVVIDWSNAADVYLSEDSMRIWGVLRDDIKPNYYRATILESYGPINVAYNGHQNNPPEEFELKYIKFPNGCEWAENDWRLSSIKEQEQSYGFIFPNPATDVLHLSADIEALNAYVMDIKGRQTPVHIEDNSVQISSLSNGLYVLQVETATGVINYRFIKR